MESVRRSLEPSSIGLEPMAPRRTTVHGSLSSLKTERTNRKVYRTRDEARADVFDYIERFYNPRRRHSKLGYITPMEFEAPRYASLTRCQRNRQQAMVGSFWSSHAAPGRIVWTSPDPPP